jgi:hypothetical protein
VTFDAAVFDAVACAYVLLDRVSVVVEMSLAQSAIEHSGPLKEMFRGGGQVNYTYALASVDRALHALGGASAS